MSARGRLALVIFGLVLGAAIGGAAWWVLREPPCTPNEEVGRYLGYIRAYREPCRVFEWDPRDPGYDNHIIRYNNIGMHDESVVFNKPDDVYRILILGDSYPQGLQVPMEQGFPELLETRLNAEQSGRYEVINTGIDTIGTDRMLMIYALFGYRFEADLVLLVTYVGNDIQNNSIELAQLRNEGYEPRPYFKLDEVGNLRLYNWDGEFPDDNSPAPDGLRRAVTIRPYPIIVPETPAILQQEPYTLEYPAQLGLYLPEDDTWAEAWAISDAILEQFIEWVDAEGSDYGVVVIPDRRAVHDEDYRDTVDQFPFLGEFDALAPVERTVQQAQNHNIPTLNTLPALSVLEQANGRGFLKLDGHLTPEGHQVIADALYDWLNANGWIASP